MFVRRCGRFICQVSSCAVSKPGIDVGDRDEAAQQQDGAGGDRDRERDFGDDQRGARAAAKRAADGAAAGVLQAGLRIHARRAQRRQDADQHAGDHRRHAGGEQHAPVDADFVHARRCRPARARSARCTVHHITTMPTRPPAIANSTLSVSNCRAMRDAAGAERGARRQLLLARDAAREQEVGDVHRRHDQHERDAGQQDHQRRRGSCRPTDRSIGTTVALQPLLVAG